MVNQTQSFLRNGANARSIMKASSTRSNLRRPVPLALSPKALPGAQVSSFSVLLSPSTTKAMKSPHVHFPPSPSQLVATFVTHGPSSYDRGPISISPNPLTMPGWGERVYSPSVDGFKLQAPPLAAFRTLQYQPSPVITDFADPRSPKLVPAAKVNKSRSMANTIRFEAIRGIQTLTVPKKLETALSSYPRSPYPSAPISPTEVKELGPGGANGTAQTSSWPRNRANSLQENKRNKKNLTLGPQFATPKSSNSNVIGNSAFTPIPSPLGRSIFSPAVASLNRAHKPAPLAMDSLTQEFWQAVSLEESASNASAADSPMVTALEYPESAVEYDEKFDMTLRSASQPPLMYADAQGALWSPGLPKPRAALDKIRESLMSPAVGKSFARTSTIVRKDFTAPSPNDPFAAFPSFSNALQMAGLNSAIQYPPRVALNEV